MSFEVSLLQNLRVAEPMLRSDPERANAELELGGPILGLSEYCKRLRCEFHRWVAAVNRVNDKGTMQP